MATARAKRTTRRSSEAGDVRTVVYVHGIGNKPIASTLKCQWDHAAFAMAMGDRTRMAYWVDRERYPEALDATCRAADASVSIVQPQPMEAASVGRPLDDGEWIERQIEQLTADRREAKQLAGIASRMLGRASIGTSRGRTRALPLPPLLRREVTRAITRVFLRDAYDFLFVEARRAEMQAPLRERLTSGGGPFIVVAHSQGTMIAYDVLRQLSARDCDVRLLVTLGSPLGLTEVKDRLRKWAGRRRLTVPACVDRWVNVADRLDPVAADPRLANDYAARADVKVEDVVRARLNLDAPRHPHSATGYLRSPEVRGLLRGAAGNAFSQFVTDFVIARDLSSRLEDGDRDQRHPVLIQLIDERDGRPLDETRQRLAREITRLVGRARLDAAAIEPLTRYLAADLTRAELEALRARHAELHVHKVWRDSAKKALITESGRRIHVTPARFAHASTGRDIHWAVLDTGIRVDHPHFTTGDTLAARWDCTRRGKPVSGGDDANGHGTHVAGILAGAAEIAGMPLTGMAPEAKLHTYKVLDDLGEGRDSWIIKACEHIAETNEAAGYLAIHGVNVSLGGPYDPSVYGCGHSPLCDELRRLWRQGVLVVVAAGNEGFAVLESEEGPVDANLDLSIGDPANLAESIGVGSVHKRKPHIYGVSYFSSRGPTADGRPKPDVVAPGEKIISARNRFRRKRRPSSEDLYVEMTGTSMAASHVSGLLASFLSVRREFIGYPDKVKRILLDHCTDLGRDPYIQGRGLPNLARMLANT